MPRAAGSLTMRQHSDSGLGDSYADRPLADRCLQGFNSGPPMTPGAYNNNVEIVQAPGVVVIVNEMVHNARVIPTDGRPHTTLRQWSGDSRGRWDGETLVVETINFRRETSLQGSTANTRLVERFTKVDAETIKYEFTVTDPAAYTRPWTRDDAADTNPRTALRVRLPRGQLFTAKYSRRCAQTGEGEDEVSVAQGRRCVFRSLSRLAVTLHFATAEPMCDRRQARQAVCVLERAPTFSGSTSRP